MSPKGFRPELTGSSLQQWFRLFTAAAQCDFSRPLFKSCSFCTRSIFAQTTGLGHAHVFRHCKAAIYFSLLGSSLQNNALSLLQSAVPRALSVRWLECSRTLPWLNRSCFSFRDIFDSSTWYCMVYIMCTRVVRNTIFSIPFPVSLEKTWGKRDEQSLCSVFTLYKWQSHMPSVLCLCLFTGVEHSLPSCVDGGGLHSWDLRQPQPAWSLISVAVSFTAIACRESVVCFLELHLKFSPVRYTWQTCVTYDKDYMTWLLVIAGNRT